MTAPASATLRTVLLRCLPLTAALACASSAPPPREFDGARALEYARTQLAFGPRIPGTPGHDRMAAWLDSTLRTTADSVVVQAWEHTALNGKKLGLKNFLARYNTRATTRVMFFAHWDTRPRSDGPTSTDSTAPVPGANDGASGVAVLLAMADRLKAQAPAIGIDLLFVDGEDYGDFYAPDRPDVLIGARYYADHPVAPLPKYAVLLDMIGDRTLTIPQEGFSLSAAPQAVEKIWDAAARLGYGSTFRAEAGGPITDDHVEFHRVGIPAVDIIDIDYPWWHTKDDTLDKIGQRSLQIVGDVMMYVVRTERP
ncbi:MAG TPA: M28 family peptidase [Gemmatimonadales bacterium]|nr:M28 family peptidase [Gemmatimonadales bacterium]